MADFKTICIIPARGGSKRLPRKNVADFLGKPIIAYTVEAALQCADLFSRVLVSTEDEEIAEIAKRAGAELARRPPELASDKARIVDVCIDLIDSEAMAGRSYDVLCCLFATAPMRTADDIRNTMSLINPGRVDFAMAVTNYDLPAHQAMRQNADGTLSAMWPDLVNARSQDIGELLCDNGSTYAASIEPFRRHRTFHGPGVLGYHMPRRRSIDIDLPEDLDMARLIAGLNVSNQG